MGELTIKRDGHIHTPLCPHGSKDSFESYILKAMSCGREEMSFTEHFPLPAGIAPQAFIEECSLKEEQLESYVLEVRKVQKLYKEQIKINLGFEVDYIEGKEEEDRKRLNKYGHLMEDGLLSVHFLLWKGQYYCVDGLEGFEALREALGSTEAVYDLYYKTLIKSVQADLGPYKPKRLGHPSLVRIFNQKYPTDYEPLELYNELAQLVLEKGYQIDLNVAGMRKPFCKEAYPTTTLLKKFMELGIQVIYGSDAHEAKDIESINHYHSNYK